MSMWRKEIDYSRHLIERTTRRLEHQRAIVDGMSADRDPAAADLATALVKMLEDRLALMRRKHQDVLAEARDQAFERPTDMTSRGRR